MKKLMSDNIGIILSFIALSYYDSIIPLLNVIGKMQTIYSFKQDDSTFTIITIRTWHYQYLHVVQITFTETC